MFYVAEALLLSKGMTFSSHSAVISAFGKEFAKPGTVPGGYHRYLMDAQEARNTSDYQVDSQLTEEEALQHIAHAGISWNWARSSFKAIQTPPAWPATMRSNVMRFYGPWSPEMRR